MISSGFGVKNWTRYIDGIKPLCSEVCLQKRIRP